MQPCSTLLLPMVAPLIVVAAGCGSSHVTTTTASPTVAAEKTSSAKPTQLLPGARTRVLAAAGNKAFDKTFDDIRFEMKIDDRFQRQMLTDDIEQMFGKRIRIRGFMLPTPQKTGIRQFVLVRDNQECCFGPGAALYDCIFVEMSGGKTAEYSNRPIAVEGTFRFKEIVGPDRRHLAIYHIAGESAR